ncbi:MAG: hypothetical protein AAFR04_11595 [Pseudomonadota bacterium]
MAHLDTLPNSFGADYAGRDARARTRPAGGGFFSRFLQAAANARAVKGQRMANAHLATLGDAQLRQLGFREAQIAELRATNWGPAGYWY